jgi:hypothetical protein
MSIKFFIFSISLLLVLNNLSCSEPYHSENVWRIEDGYVPDSSTAVQIAEIVWVRIYGKDIYSRRPFKAKLVSDEVWHIEGTLKPGWDGGVPYAEIQKKDGKIITIYHTK